MKKKQNNDTFGMVSQTWQTLEKDGVQAVVPVWDTDIHEIGDPHCKCNPEYTINGEVIQIVHRSYRDEELINNSLKHFNEKEN